MKHMKSLAFTVALVILCMVGSFAQTGEQQVKRWPPIEKKQLHLKYLGSDSSSVLERIHKKELTSRYLQKQHADTSQEKQGKPGTGMPYMLPDPSIKFQILTVVPDSTTHFHLKIKKAE